MIIQKLNVKIFVRAAKDLKLSEFIPIFQKWIQKDAIKGLLIDVADYSHVRNGPGILLVAHEFHLSMDESESKLGLVYCRKQPVEGPNDKIILQALGAALESCDLLEKDPSLKGRLEFNGGKMAFQINDRLIAPNHDETFAEFQSPLNKVLSSLYGEAKYILQREPDSKKRFSVMVEAKKGLSISDLLEKLS